MKRGEAFWIGIREVRLPPREDKRRAMDIQKLAKFAVELEDLANRYGFVLVETPAWTYGPSGTGPGRSHNVLWPVYDAEKGLPTTEVMAHFKLK